MRKFETKFAAYLHFGKGSSTSFALTTTLAEALSKVASEAIYYLGHHPTTRAHIEEQCAECFNVGTIPKARKKYERKTCPACRGKNDGLLCVEFEIRPPAGVVSIDNGTGDVLVRA